MQVYNQLQALDQAREFFQNNSDIELIEVILTDLNGIPRGKWVPVDEVESICKGTFKMSLTSTTADIWGRDVPSLCEAVGDGDGIVLPVMSSLKRIPWLKKPTAQLFLEQTVAGIPGGYDPRVVLKKVIERYEARGLKAVTAPELEFYLFLEARGVCGEPLLPSSRVNGTTHLGGQLYSTDMLRDNADMLYEMREACLSMGVPITVLGKELSAGQWELNLNHVDCPLAAADNAQMLKRAIKSVAKKYGLVASFIAKPSAELDGSGFHTHISVLDSDGNNIFNDGTDQGTQALRHAIGGLAKTMSDTFLMFIPHLNSFRRLHVGDHAPKSPTWGYENRYVSMRVPDGSPTARRIEHRLGGADANPYLLLAALLSGVLYGLDNKIDAGDPCEDRQSAEAGDAVLPQTWQQAREVFETSEYVKEYFGENFRTSFSELKKSEQKQFDRIISQQEYDTYLVSS